MTEQEKRISALEEENAYLKSLLDEAGISYAVNNNKRETDDKVEIFMSYFIGRDDVYAKRSFNKTSGKASYYPQCDNLWQVGICHRKDRNKIKCQDCANRKWSKLTREVVEAHLKGLAYDGSAMRQIDAGEILDIAMAGTSATLLARRWESALLVNVDNETLARLMANDAAMDALMRIEGFRTLNQDIATIINKSEHVKGVKKNADNLSPREIKQLSDEEKEYKSKRKQIQDKLIKFATRIPVFMYLTDYREYSLKDVITKLEPALFKKVTGLNLEDFELLVSLNVFNEALMNDAVYKFKRYEDASLSYAGIDKHADEAVGLFSTVLSRDDYDMMAGQLASSMVAEKQDPNDLPDFSTAVRLDNEDDEKADTDAA